MYNSVLNGQFFVININLYLIFFFMSYFINIYSHSCIINLILKNSDLHNLTFCYFNINN